MEIEFNNKPPKTFDEKGFKDLKYTDINEITDYGGFDDDKKNDLTRAEKRRVKHGIK